MIPDGGTGVTETGTVKWYNSRKGYGFIAGAGRDVFVHATAVQDAGLQLLREGQAVRFTIQKGGPHVRPVAVNIRLVESPDRSKTFYDSEE